MDDGPVRDYIKAQEVARKLNIRNSYAYKLMRTGEIPIVRSERYLRVRPEDLEAYILHTSITPLKSGG